MTSGRVPPFSLEKMKEIRVQRDLFCDGKEMDFSSVRDFIARSWQRSKDADVVRDDALSVSVDERELAQIKFMNSALLEVSVPLMEKLHGSINGTRSLISLVSAEGVVLHIVGTVSDLACSPGLGEGCVVKEQVVGTNGMGTCLYEGRPIQVLASEHYHSGLHLWCCSAAPIFDRKNEIIGCLNISTEIEGFHFHTLGAVCAAVDAISEQLRLREAIQSQQTIMELLDEGVVVIDKVGVISAINRQAREMLGVDELSVGLNISQVICRGIDFEALQCEQKRLVDKEVHCTLQKGTLSCYLSTSPIASGAGMVMRLKANQRIRDFANRVHGSSAYYSFEDIVGKSAALEDALHFARIAGKSDATALILGESGTGKEMFAQAIHNSSSRSKRPFIAVNCGAIPRNLVQSELFGYEAGAFTGGQKDGRPGKFELADGGTLFLDEIGDMPFEAQVSLLRLLQEGEVVRVGGSRARKVDVRVIAATHRDLALAVADKLFRADLYYRLNVLAIKVPALRERSGDVALLAEFLLAKFAKSLGRRFVGFTEDVWEALHGYSWPGNVRELENFIERAANIAAGDEVGLTDFPDELTSSVATSRATCGESASLLKESEAEVIASTLQQTGGNLRVSAHRLGIARSTLYKKIKRHGLSVDEFRSLAIA